MRLEPRVFQLVHQLCLFLSQVVQVIKIHVLLTKIGLLQTAFLLIALEKTLLKLQLMQNSAAQIFSGIRLYYHVSFF